MRSVACVAGAGVAFGTVSVIAKRAYEAGSEPSSLLAVRLVVCAAVVTALGSRSRETVRPRHAAMGAIAGAAFAGAGLLEFHALARLQATAVVVLLFVAPVWIALGTWLVRGTAPGGTRAGLIGLILLGIAALVGTPGAHGVELRGAALALGASLFAALFFVGLERLAGEGRRPMQAACLAAWGASAATVIVEPRGVVRELAAPATAPYGVAIGLLTAGGLVLLAAGIRATAALSASAIIGVEPLVAALLAWLFLGELLTATQLAGAASVLLGVTGMCVFSVLEHRAPGATGRTRRPRRGSRPPPRPAKSAPRRR